MSSKETWDALRSAALAASFTAVGAVGAWVWSIDRTVTVMHAEAQHYVTQEELIRFVSVQNEVNKKVDVVYGILVESRIRPIGP